MPPPTDLARPPSAAAPWWAVSSDEVVASLGGDADAGLTGGEAARRLERFGRNELPSPAGPSLLRRLVTQFADPLVFLLLGAILVSLAAWGFEQDTSLPVEAIVIALIVVANAWIGVWQEGKASRAVEALRELAAARTTVVRDGRRMRVSTALVVPGDVAVLGQGDSIGFDGRVLDAASVETNEAPLTGESLPVAKSSALAPPDATIGDRSSMVFSGTSLVTGRCRAIVTSTGSSTEIGRIATLLEDAEVEPTPLQRQVAALGRTLGIAVAVLVVVVAVAIATTSELGTAEDWLDVLLVAVSLAVAAVPEGLPAIMTVVLALGVQRMSRRNAIVKRLLSVETLGSATVICTDKTGTLTRNEMTAVRVATSSGTSTLTGVGYLPDGTLEADSNVDRGEAEALLRCAALACDATFDVVADEWVAHGDPTEIAIVVAAHKVGSAPGDDERLAEVPFDSDRKLMSVLLESSVLDARSGVTAVQITKGAPDVLLDRCERRLEGERTVPFDDVARRRISTQIHEFGADGLRTIGVARRDHRRDPEHFDESSERDLEWLGVIAISDPPRAEAADVIARARRAGIRTMMLTGDHPLTAASIGAAVGLGDHRDPVDGSMLASVDWDDDEERRAIIASTDVFARVQPEHKLRLVEALQAEGDIVAMTGDGVNDAPALRRADIGVAMGGVGTDVAREASDMVLADDDFATIVTAIEEGRDIFADIRKFLRYLLASNSGEVLVMVLGVLAAGALGLRLGDGLAVPLLATQILWINLLTDSALALALGVDPSVEDTMERPPRRLDDPLLDRPMWITILVVGVTTALAGLVALDLELEGGMLGGDGDIESARTMAFTTVVLAQIFNAFNARSDRVSAFVRVFDNPLLWLAAAVTVVLQVAVVHLGFLNRAFDTTPLDAGQWATCWLLAATVLVADEFRKLPARRRAAAAPT